MSRLRDGEESKRLYRIDPDVGFDSIDTASSMVPVAVEVGISRKCADDVLVEECLQVLRFIPAPVLSSDQDGSAIEANAGFCEVSGYSSTELSSKNVDDLFGSVGCGIDWRSVAGGSVHEASGAAVVISNVGAPLHVHVAVAAITLVSGRRLLWVVEDRSAAYWECPSTWGV